MQLRFVQMLLKHTTGAFYLVGDSESWDRTARSKIAIQNAGGISKENVSNTHNFLLLFVFRT